MKDTIRIIMFLDCNLKCGYCCNEKSQFNRLFIEQSLYDIDFSKYKNVCISGGEPFLRKDILYKTLNFIPNHMPIFLYTNGIRIENEDIHKLQRFNIAGINVGLHHINQLKSINRMIDNVFSVRYVAWEGYKNQFQEKYPALSKQMKFWVMDACIRENEDWVLLNNF